MGAHIQLNLSRATFALFLIVSFHLLVELVLELREKVGGWTDGEEGTGRVKQQPFKQLQAISRNCVAAFLRWGRRGFRV